MTNYSHNQFKKFNCALVRSDISQIKIQLMVLYQFGW